MSSQPRPVEPESASTPAWMVIIGWIFSLLPAAMLIFSAVMKLTHAKPPPGSPDVEWPAHLYIVLALLELSCTFLYLYPRTAVLGAVLLTGYIGGAVAAHVRIGDMF